MSIDGFMVNGSALLYTGTGGGGALELLGYTDNGVRMRVIENYSDIISDVFGPMTPHDIQQMGMVANISVPLIACDRSVLAKVTGRSNRAAVGQIGTPGLVMGVAGYAFRVGIASPADNPWSFPYCITRPGFDTQLATKANPFVLEFFAWPWGSYTVINATNQTLWTRSLA